MVTRDRMCLGAAEGVSPQQKPYYEIVWYEIVALKNLRVFAEVCRHYLGFSDDHDHGMKALR